MPVVKNLTLLKVFQLKISLSSYCMLERRLSPTIKV